MNFTDLVSLVVSSTKRPDKKQLAQTSINAAVLLFSTEHDYERDLQESLVDISPASAQHVIDLSSLTRFRKVDYLKYAGTSRYIQKLQSRILTPGCNLLDKYYVVGSSIKVNMAMEASALDLSYFAYPPVLTDAAPEYWLLEGNWEAVYKMALSKVFTDIGDAESARAALQEATLSNAVFRGDYVRANQHT